MPPFARRHMAWKSVLHNSHLTDFSTAFISKQDVHIPELLITVDFLLVGGRVAVDCVLVEFVTIGVTTRY